MFISKQNDAMKKAYLDVAHSIKEEGAMDKGHVISLINNILKRKRFTMTSCEVFTHFLL